MEKSENKVNAIDQLNFTRIRLQQVGANHLEPHKSWSFVNRNGMWKIENGKKMKQRSSKKHSSWNGSSCPYPFRYAQTLDIDQANFADITASFCFVKNLCKSVAKKILIKTKESI